MEFRQTSIKALTVNVFGTVADWYSTIVREGERLGYDADWARFAKAWRNGYEPAMGRVRSGELPWTKIDALHRMNDYRGVSGVYANSEKEVTNYG